MVPFNAPQIFVTFAKSNLDYWKLKLIARRKSLAALANF